MNKQEDSLHIAWLNWDTIWKDVDANLEALDKALEEIQKPPELLLLPEMFSTGFICHDLAFTSAQLCKALNWMKEKAREKNMVICGSLLWKEKAYTNRLFWVPPNGDIQEYDKKHLFSYGGEDREIKAGNEQQMPVVQYKNWKIGLSICYDLRFPMWQRNYNDYHLMINVANWPTARDLHWETLLRARAIENQSFVAGVNRKGVDGNGIAYTGNSLIFNYNGEVLCQASSSELYQHTILDKKQLLAHREKFPFLKDRDIL